MNIGINKLEEFRYKQLICKKKTTTKCAMFAERLIDAAAIEQSIFKYTCRTMPTL